MKKHFIGLCFFLFTLQQTTPGYSVGGVGDQVMDIQSYTYFSDMIKQADDALNSYQKMIEKGEKRLKFIQETKDLHNKYYNACSKAVNLAENLVNKVR